MITQEEAIKAAEEAIRGKIKTEKDAPVTAELKDNEYIVTFGHIVPPLTLGPDFTARVTVDARSGKVVHIITGAD